MIPFLARFSGSVTTRPGPNQPPVKWETGILPRVKVAGGAEFNTHPYPASVLKKEYSYISMPPLGPNGLFQGELYSSS
jgi:hypothetical protein